MSFLRQNDCCCFFSLSTGSKIIAVFTVLMGLTSEYNGFSAIGVAEKYVYIIEIIVGICAIIIGLMLYYGAATKRAGFVYPYVLVNAIRIIVGIVLTILTAVYGHLWVAIVWFICGYIVSIYFTLVVYSFYKELGGGMGSNV